MLDLGVYAYLERIHIFLPFVCFISLHFVLYLSSVFCLFLRLSEEAAAMWKKHLERDDSRIVGRESYPVIVIHHPSAAICISV